MNRFTNKFHTDLKHLTKKEMNMTDNKYNGWTNYATWRINLEIFDGYDPEGQELDPDSVKDMAEEIILMDVDATSLVGSYAMAFISDVNWTELAEHLNEELKEGNENQ